jgi:hypothetical protein
MSERDELLAGIQAALKGASGPVAPRVPGIPTDAPQYVRDAAVAALTAKPAHLLTQDEAAYVTAVKDAAVHATLSKPIDQISTDERAQLLKQVRDCAERGWQ